MMIILVLLIGFGIYYLVTNKSDRNFKPKNESVDILKLRYVNGEIDDETYKKMLELIRK